MEIRRKEKKKEKRRKIIEGRAPNIRNPCSKQKNAGEYDKGVFHGLTVLFGGLDKIGPGRGRGRAVPVWGAEGCFGKVAEGLVGRA
jgi:hypothetical protein